MALLADGVAPGDVYKTLETPEGLDRAFAKLKALNPIWAHDSVGALGWVKNGQAVMATALNGDVYDAAQKDFTPGVIWDHQLYELDVFGIPAGDPQQDSARWISSPMPPAARRWPAWRAGCRTARRGAPSLPLVKNNPETGTTMRPWLPTAPENFRNAFAVDRRRLVAGAWRRDRRPLARLPALSGCA